MIPRGNFLRGTFLSGVAIGLMVCVAASGCRRDAAWPSRPITLVCPWSAGGGTDRVSRQVAVQLEAQLGVPVNVVNATGGGGVTGHTRGALARPDGYTLVMATVELNMLHWRGLCPVTPESFRPLARLNQDSAAIFVRADAPWTSVVELEQAFRDAKQPIPVSGTAAGGIWHLALVGWLLHSDVPIDSANWISINGSAPSLQELLAGGVEVVCCSIPEAGALLDAGEVKCLGVMSEQRSPAAPDVPTFDEQGVDWSMGGWRGLAYPRGVPEDRAEKMEAAVLTVARSEPFAEFMDTAGFNVSVTDGSRFTSFLAESDAEFGEILTAPAMQQRQAAPLNAYFVPGLLAMLAVIAAGFGFISARRGRLADVDEKTPASVNVRLMFGFAVAIALFIIGCETVGYVIAAGLLLSAMLWMLRASIPTAAMIVVVAVPGLYQVFAGVLGVPLPWGWLGW
ncbi:tripartite tricarboxylate transporter substrate-binding protein [Roseimaritima ulvae]|uniref:Tripartite tricarboxylate transporter family receptor n=1 Tax=Roseimaritima ulvae TaxID=980254 RepID=A0A5B9QTZ1_9BACT|nr:tripartite tricarboxylate transporter substrate-binding protein [Roseimaritima ulvae]QEG40875.1 Tripartite tricarboxylate transporter family receptor [Roseimaritima ulvae]